MHKSSTVQVIGQIQSILLAAETQFFPDLDIPFMMVAFSSKTSLFVGGLLMIAAVLAPEADVHGWIQNPLARQFCNGDQVQHQCSTSRAVFSGLGTVQ